jgi:hypothetical protein
MRRSASTATEFGRNVNALLVIGSILLLNEAATRRARRGFFGFAVGTLEGWFCIGLYPGCLQAASGSPCIDARQTANNYL